jgi:hypothetical protein
MRKHVLAGCVVGAILGFGEATVQAGPYTIDDCIKSARNGCEICDDAVFVVPNNTELVLVCLDDNGGKGYISSNTGPKMEDGVARCQGWEQKGLKAWDYLNYVDSLVCDKPQKLINLNLTPGKKYWMGIHDYPKVGKGHFTMACLAPKGGGTPPIPEIELKAISVQPTNGYGCGTTFVAGYSHSQGAGTFRIVQLWIGLEVVSDTPMMGAALENGLFQTAGQSCLPGEDKVIEAEYGSLDCAASSFYDQGNERWVNFAITFNTETFAGKKGIFFDAKGGEGDPEPRLGWTEMGVFTVVDEPTAMGCAAKEPTPDSDEGNADADAGNGPNNADADTGNGPNNADDGDYTFSGFVVQPDADSAPGASSGKGRVQAGCTFGGKSHPNPSGLPLLSLLALFCITMRMAHAKRPSKD